MLKESYSTCRRCDGLFVVVKRHENMVLWQNISYGFYKNYIFNYSFCVVFKPQATRWQCCNVNVAS